MNSKEISMDITNFNKRDWTRVAEDLCYPGIREKFFQNQGLMAVLLHTGTKKVVESSFNDIWSTGIPISNTNALDETKWKSTGHLGKILMSIRAEKHDIIGGNDEMDMDNSVSTGTEAPWTWYVEMCVSPYSRNTNLVETQNNISETVS